MKIKTWKERCNGLTQSYEKYLDCAIHEIKDLRVELKRVNRKLAEYRKGKK